MIGPRHDATVPQVWLATAPVDMRKSFDGLAEIVRTFLGQDPLAVTAKFFGISRHKSLRTSGLAFQPLLKHF